jgi:hypothetical protein
MMEIYAASKKLAPSELDIPEKSDKANKPPTKWKSRQSIWGQAAAARPP